MTPGQIAKKCVEVPVGLLVTTSVAGSVGFSMLGAAIVFEGVYRKISSSQVDAEHALMCDTVSGL